MRRFAYSSIALLLVLLALILVWKKYKCACVVLEEQQKALIKKREILKEKNELSKALEKLKVFMPDTDRERYEKVLAFMDSLSGFRGVNFKIQPLPVYGALKKSYFLDLTAKGDQAITTVANFLYTQVYPILNIKEVVFKVTGGDLLMNLKAEVLLE